MKYNPNKVYIVFDGTSHYALYGYDVEDDIKENDSEVVMGPYNEWESDEVDNIVEDLNKEVY